MFTAVVSYMKHLGVRTKSSDSKKSRLFFKKKPKKPDEPSSKHKILSNLLRETSSWIGGGNVENRPSKTDSEGDKTSHKPNGRTSADPPTSSTRKPGSCSLTVVPDTSEGSQVTISVTNSPDSTHSDTAASSGRSDSQSLSDSADQSPGARGGSCAPDAPPPCDTPSEESAETENSDSVAVQPDQPQPGPVSAPAEECEPRTAELEQDPPNWRECIPPETSKTLSKRETKRQEVINELFLTEHAHVRMLTVLQNVFARPMERESIMTTTELEAIFPNLDEIIEMHYSFYESLKRLRQESSFIVKAIGQTLLSRFSGAEGEWFQKLSARFCSHQSYALDFIKGRQKKDPKFNTFIQEAESKPQCRRLQLKDIIPIEMQRLTKYPLLLENIAKSTDDEAEKNRIQQAADCCKKILNHVNDEVKNMENLLSLKDYQRRLDVSGLKPSNELMAEFKNLDLTQRRMIFEGPLTWRVTKEKAIDVQALLLTDILVLLQKQDDKMVLKCQSKSTTGVQEGKQMLSPIIKLGSVFLRDVATDRKAFYVIFTWDSGAQIYELVAQTVSEMKNWTELITSAAADQKQAAVVAPVERKRFGSYVPPGNIPQSPTLPTDNGAISLKDPHLSSTDRDKDSLLDGRGGASWASLLAANGIDPITLGQASEEKLANGALDEVHSLKRMLVRSISLSEEPQSETSPVSENPPSLGPEGEEPSDQSGGAGDEHCDTDSRQSPEEGTATEGRAEPAGEDDSGPGQEECGISAPLLLSHDQVTTVERSLKLLEEKLRQLQGLEEEYHKLHKCLSKAFFSQQSLS
ncbi:ARHG1 factor, partial [Atractosteus spatula]|nr:ARHG1 factor [Atractosteus spatula]